MKWRGEERWGVGRERACLMAFRAHSNWWDGGEEEPWRSSAFLASSLSWVESWLMHFQVALSDLGNTVGERCCGNDLILANRESYVLYIWRKETRFWLRKADITGAFQCKGRKEEREGCEESMWGREGERDTPVTSRGVRVYPLLISCLV